MTDLAALLAQERDRLTDDWARSLGRLFPGFSPRPPGELIAAGHAVLDDLARYLQSSDAEVLRALAGQEAVVHLLREVDLSDVQRGIMVLREQAARLLERRVTDPMAQSRAYARLVAATDLLLLELARRQERARRPATEAEAAQESLEVHLARETRRALRFRRPLALLLVAVDGFEEVARVYGMTLAETASGGVQRILDRLTREVDIKVRLEDGTFALVLLETGLKDARWIAERIRAAVEAGEGIEKSLLLTGLTVSIGLAGFPLHADNAAAYFRAADESLLHARRLGGNTVVVVDELRSGERVT